MVGRIHGQGNSQWLADSIWAEIKCIKGEAWGYLGNKYSKIREQQYKHNTNFFVRLFFKCGWEWGVKFSKMRFRERAQGCVIYRKTLWVSLFKNQRVFWRIGSWDDSFKRMTLTVVWGLECIERRDKLEGPDCWVNSNFPVLGSYFWTNKWESRCSASKFLLPPLRKANPQMLSSWPFFLMICVQTPLYVPQLKNLTVCILSSTFQGFLFCVLAQRIIVQNHTAHRRLQDKSE